jgi:hypothetical protein
MIKLEKIQKRIAPAKKLTSVSLTLDNAQYIKDNNIVLTKLVEEAIENLRNGGNNDNNAMAV